jgi:hypothetical protein|tara:strand:- start:406 stop:1140 length:735 start_codon:yes stop_codon:yes gene_type:complete
MGYLNTYSAGSETKTLKIYLTDYGKSVMVGGNNLVSAITKFGLSDNDINYVGMVDEDCVNDGVISTNCFHDVPDVRGAVQSTADRNYGSLDSIMNGPKCDVNHSTVNVLGNTVIPSTLWSTGSDGIEAKGMIHGCWGVGESIVIYYPTYCNVCTDFNGDGITDIEDFKSFITTINDTADEGEDLVGDFNGDGVVDSKDLDLLIKCLPNKTITLQEYCKDSSVFCLLCDKLGDESPCPGNCTKCI